MYKKNHVIKFHRLFEQIKGKEQDIQSFISFFLWVKRHLLPLVCSLLVDFVSQWFESFFQ